MPAATGMLMVIKATLRTLSRPMSGSASISPSSASPKQVDDVGGERDARRDPEWQGASAGAWSASITASPDQLGPQRRQLSAKAGMAEYCPSKARLKVPPTGPTEEMNRASAVRDGPQPPLVS